ncbi:hypothetical protein DC522_04980 [Microvirga sp. KLBC 81]|uniref:YiaA/YiaB family inner membrane protein n=1 Tax=Microvirga sp. KLBC 81 TaxID=1862707 RepID=UPI000D51105A|nr:YiaA/YiaB family inner membrane protein [Microvirga sp. KLBC 81]PVE25671.1 hypothetical protein DC522_04980 [Microvirga sp. KLBC 81]
MNSQMPHTASWKAFTLVSFALAVGMLALGIYALPADLWAKGYLAMAAVFSIGSTFTLAKTQRDEYEARRLINRIDEVKTERLLRDEAA